MRATNRLGKVSINFLFWGLIAIWWLFVVPKGSAQTYDFDEGIEVVTKGLISENKAILKNKKIAVFGIIESKSREKWEISSHIEDGIVDALVNNGYRVIERRRIQDVIKKEIKKVTDQWFDQARVAQFGKLVGADFVVTGRYVLWGQGMLKISIRAINVADGEIVAADKVKVHTDRIANLLKSEEKKKHVKEAKVSPEKPAVEPATESKKTTFSINANVSDAKVLVDGREIGRTPLSDVTVSPGERKITVEKQGYEPYRKTILLDKGRSMSLYVDLSEAVPRKGRLFVETAPDDANVKILNIGPKFHQGMELDPGRYHVEVSARNYRAEKMWVDLSAGEDKNISMRLERVRLQAEPKTFTNSLGMKFVEIPSGSFMMGGGISASEVASHYGGKEESYKDEYPQHSVTVSKPFFMQTMEVTVGQWRSFVQDTGYKTEAETGGGARVWTGKEWEKKEGTFWDNPMFNQSGNNPVTCVSLNDVQAFLKWLNRKEANTYRLPTEAEWEYAARAGTKTPFYTGDCLSTEQANYNGNYPGKGCNKGTNREKTTRVGTFSPNPWGLYDMHGNVFEWCQDWYGHYPSGPVTDPTGPSSGADRRVVRGCSWVSIHKDCRSAKRFRPPPDYRCSHLGFRLARTP